MKNIWIVLVAEVKRRLTSRAFLFGVIVGMLGVAAMIKLPTIVVANVEGNETRIVLAGDPHLTARARGLLTGDTVVAIRTQTTAPTAADLDRMRAGRLIVLESDGPSLSATVYAKNSQSVSIERLQQRLAPLRLELAQHLDPAKAAQLLSIPVTVHGVNDAFASPASAAIARVIGFALLFVLYLIVILNSQLTLNSVIEEKTNRIAELLVAAIDPLALLYGKIAASIVLAVIQMVAWGVAAFAAGGGFNLLLSAQPAGPQHGEAAASMVAIAGAIKPFAVPGFLFFLFVGLLQFSTIYAAIGSLVSRPEDLGSISSALIVPIVAAFITAILALDAPNSGFVIVASFIPLISPFVMFVRVVMDDPPLWQLLVCAIVNLAFLGFVAVAAGRLYRVGMLLYGRPPKLAQIWKTIREG